VGKEDTANIVVSGSSSLPKPAGVRVALGAGLEDKGDVSLIGRCQRVSACGHSSGRGLHDQGFWLGDLAFQVSRLGV
jgi:hypothetical protein